MNDMYLVRDPVHMTIPLSRDEMAVVNHPHYQRLRRIKQTAFLFEVFPGATHTRFSHSLGAMHMAGQLFDKISEEFTSSFGPRSLKPEQKDYFRRLVRIAALLHDVGHGPFSHSIEGVNNAGRPIHPSRQALLNEGPIPNHWINEKGPATKDKWLKTATHHEEFSVAIIAMMANSDGRLGGCQAQDVAALLTDWVKPTPEFEQMNAVGPSGRWSLKAALKALVSGEIDADRMDYLLRDSHYTGVPYGQYDKEMLVENVVWRPASESDTELQVCVKRKALHAFEDFLMSRYHMFLQVYSHKTVVGFDVMLENALAELPDFQIHPNLQEYLTWHDEWLLGRILADRSSRWGVSIRDRLPLKLLFTVRPEDQAAFMKFIGPFEQSKGTTAWFPSLKNKLVESSKKARKEAPRLWWRHCKNYLTRDPRGTYPISLVDRGRLVSMEESSFLLKSNYARQMEIIHVYCQREEERDVLSWLLDAGIPEAILAKSTKLV